jgi:uncharacterized protein (DUF4415 family)
MKSSNEFPFQKARRLTPVEVEKNRRAIEHHTGKPRRPRGRPAKEPHELYFPVSIRLNPKALEWAKRMGRQRGIGYQTVINEALLSVAGKKKLSHAR